MKGIIKNLVVAILLIPFAFIFSACVKKEEYDKQANVDSFTNAVEELMSIGDNYTQTVSFNIDDDSKELLAEMGMDFEEISGFVYKKDGSDYSVSVGSDTYMYYLDGVSYLYEDEGYFVDYITSYTGYEIQIQYLDISNYDLNALKDLAFRLNDKAITITNTPTGKNISIKLDVDTAYNKLIDNIDKNLNRPLHVAVDKFLSDFIGNISSVELITELKQLLTEDTTYEQVIKFIEEKFKVDLTSYIQTVFTEYSEAGSYGDYTYSEYGYGFLKFNYENSGFDYETVKGLKCLEQLELTKQEVDEALDMAIDALNNKTLKDVIISLIMEESDYFESGYNEETTKEDAEKIWTDTYKQIKSIDLSGTYIQIDLITDDNGKIEGYAVKIDVTYSQTSAGKTVTVKFAGEISCSYSKIGTTSIKLPTNMVKNGYRNMIVANLYDVVLGESFIIGGFDDSYPDFIIDGVASMFDSDISIDGKELVIEAAVMQKFYNPSNYEADTIVLICAEKDIEIYVVFKTIPKA